MPTKVERRAATRIKEFSADRFTRVFKSTREEPRQKALDEIEQFHLGDADLPAALWQVIEAGMRNRQVPPSLLRAIRLHGRIDGPEIDEQQARLLTAGDGRVVILALENLAARKVKVAPEKLAALRKRPEYPVSYAFRHAVVSAAGRMVDPGAVDFLVDVVAESDGQLKYVASRQLAELTGQNFGGLGDDWRSWWAAHRETIARDGLEKSAAEAKGGASPDIVPWTYALPKFFDAPIYAKRVVFIIDRSRSMLSSVDDVTRLEEAQQELQSAIMRLPDDAWFDIIAYNTTLMVWKGQLTQATTATRSDARRFIYSLFGDGKTALYDALEDGLTVDPNLEAMLFLSDGDPTAGKIVDRARIVQEITAQNSSRRIAIDVLGIDSAGPAEDFLKQLAAANFGTYRAVR